MALPQEQSSLSDLVHFQAQKMTQLLAAINGPVTQQTAATSAPPSPTAPPFRAFNPDCERWPEYIAQLEAHFAAYDIPATTAPPPRARLQASPLPVRSPAPDGHLPPLPRSSAVPEPMDAEATFTTPPPSTEVVALPPPPNIPRDVNTKTIPEVVSGNSNGSHGEKEINGASNPGHMDNKRTQAMAGVTAVKESLLD
ncbi:mucin-7-like [Schistocerca nitens]|uniref:mucin-7-like n=1 Tax=Schistocerca nitens TaxID=7011 RepID=UPI0021197619|nr:mucin-7-like [Schistocerca nitens]